MKYVWDWPYKCHRRPQGKLNGKYYEDHKWKMFKLLSGKQRRLCTQCGEYSDE